MDQLLDFHVIHMQGVQQMEIQWCPHDIDILFKMHLTFHSWYLTPNEDV
jgi:hypothetical protein